MLVFGASSQIGHCLLPMLGAQGAHAIAVSRSPRSGADGHARWLRGALPGSLNGDFSDVETIACFAPLAALATWLSNTPLPALTRVVATSSMSAESKRESPVAAERALAQRLREGEQALMRACESRGVACTIFRPTLIYGVGLDKSLTPLARRAAKTRVFVLPPGRGLRQPVHARDVAAAVLAALQSSATNGRTIPLGGGERLSAQEMFARVRASLPVRTLPLRLPRLAVRAAMRVLPSTHGPLSRLDADLTADNAELEALLNVHPRGFNPDSDTWVSQRAEPMP
jgi:uncharacterized protein YbjT (DUF2867 family)